MRLGAPRRLFTSLQGRTGTSAGPPADKAVEASRQAGQSSGVRGLSKRGSLVRLASPCEEEVRSGNQSRRTSLAAKNGEKGELLKKQGYGESSMLSSESDKSPNYPLSPTAVPREEQT